MNSLLQTYRQQFPDDIKTDEEVMRLYAESYPPETLSQYPDFQQDWQKLQQQQAVSQSSMLGELSTGFQRGLTGLESTGAGALALASSALGAEGAKEFYQDIYKRKVKQMAEETPPSVPTVQGAFQGPAALGQYVAGKAGELIPNIGEALAVAGAGTLAAPGPGTEAGAAAGLFGRAAAKAWIGKAIRQTLSATERKELEGYIAGTVGKDMLSKKVADLAVKAGQNLASVSANVANFAALGAGGAYGELSGREGVTEEGARAGALIAGAGASIGAMIPNQLIKAMFGEGVAPGAVRTWIDAKAVQVPKELLIAGSGMGAMEFFNILGEHYADPKLKNKDFSKQEWSRMLNAAATGIIAGAPAATITALRGRPVKPEEAAPAEPVPPEQPGPPFTPGPPKPPVAEEAATAAAAVPPGMTPAEQAALYPKQPLQQQIETEVANAIKTREEQQGVLRERERDNAELQKAEEDRLKQAEQQKEGAKAGVSDSLREEAGGIGQAAAQAWAALPPETKNILEGAGVTPDKLAANRIQELAGAMGAAGRATTEDLYQKIFDAVKAGKETVSGVRDPLIAEAKPLIESGQIKSPEELKSWVQGGKVVPKQPEAPTVPAAAAKVEPAAVPVPEAPKGTEPIDVKTLKRGEDIWYQTTQAGEPALLRAKFTSRNPDGTIRVITAAGAFNARPESLFRTKPEPVVEPKPIAPEPSKPAAPSADWVSSTPESYSAWVPAIEGKESRLYSKDYGFSGGGDDKELSNTRGVFQRPDGKIVAATVKKTRGVVRVEQGEGNRAKAFEDLQKEGWKLLGYSQGEMQKKVYREYTPEEWAREQVTLERKAAAVAAPVTPTKGAVVEAGLHEEGGETGITPKGAISEGTAGKIVEKVIQLGGGIPADSEAAERWLNAAFSSSKELRDEIARVGGGKRGAEMYIEMFRRYAEAYEDFRKSGSVDPTEFRSRIIGALKGLSAAEAKARAELVEGRETGTIYVGELGRAEEPPEGAVSESQLTGEQDIEHLVTVSEGVKDSDTRPETQVKARAILSEFSGEGKAGAFGALKALHDAGIFVSELEKQLVRELVNLGDMGVHLVTGGNHVSLTAAGKYIDATDTIRVYDNAFDRRMSGRTFLHEYVHALTVDGIESGRFYTYLNQLKEAAAAQAKREGVDFYGLKNTHEFISEAFSNSKFQEFLSRVKSPFDDMDELPNLWSKFVDFVGKLLGLKERTALADVLRLGGKIASERQPRVGTVQVPRTAIETTWHTPTLGSKALAETYNPVTGTVERAPLIQDSVEAAMLNIQRADPLEFLLPAGTTAPMPTVDPSIRMNNEAGINNKVEAVRRAAAVAGGINLKALRILHGLHNTETIREKQINEAQVKGIQGFNPAQDIAALRNPENLDYANVNAASALEKEAATLSRHLAAAKEADPLLKAKQQKLLAEHEEILDKFKDAEFMSGVIKRGARKLLYEDIRDLERVGKAVGTAFQQFQDIEGKVGQPIDPATVNAMRRLYTGESLQGERLFNFLNQMANDPSIDFTRPASEIRAYIRHAAELDPNLQRYVELAADTTDAKALLATVIAFGKLNQREMAMLQVRQMESGQERLALEQELRDQRKESNAQILTGIKSVAKASRLEEAAKLENRKALRLITRVNRNVEHNDRMIAVTEAALPHYKTEIEKLVAKIRQTEDAVFADGMKIRVPVNMDPHPKWEERTINLKATAGPVTTPEQIRNSVGQMVAWMKLREKAAQAGDETAMGSDYQRVARQAYELVNHQLYDPMMRETDHTVTGLLMSADGKKVGSIGTPSAGLIEQGLNKWVGDTTNSRNQADKLFGYKNSRLMNGVMDVLNRERSWWQRKKVTSEWFEKNILDSALGFLERGKPPEGVDLAVARDAWFAKLGPWLLSQDRVRPLIEDRMPEFMRAFREYADSVYHSGQWWVGKVEESGLLVKDPKLAGQLRKHIPIGLWTFQRKFSDGFRNMVHAMRLAGWAKDEEKGVPGASEDWKKLSALYTQDPNKALALVNKYMSDTVEKDFVYKLTHVPDESVIETPKLDESGTTMSADAAEVAQAYDDAGGNLVNMFERLHDVYNGQEARGDYVQAGMLRLAQVFHEIDSALKKVEPKGAAQVSEIEGMVPNAMIDARQFQHLPADWFTYHKFDRNDNARMAERVAWQANFGREGKAFAGWFQTAQDESNALVAKLRDALTQAERMTPSGLKNEIKAAAEKILAADTSPMLAQFKTGADRLRYLKKVDKRAPFLDSFLRDISAYFNRGNQEEGSLRWGIRMAGELAWLLVNQPSSAISQLATTLDIMAQWGLSPTTAKATARTIQMTAKDIGGSLAQGIGWEFLKASQYEKRFLEMNLNDPEVARRMGDIFTILSGEEHSRAARIFRTAKDIQSATINLVGERAQYTPLRPLSPFFQTVVSANRGLFVALSEMADGYVTKGIEYLRREPGTQKLTADMLDLKGQDKMSFEKWEADHRRYGLDFTEMVKGALDRMNNGDRTVLTNKELERIYSVGLNVISLESNIATMPLWAFNNKLVRFGLPLLGWSYRRALQVGSMRLNNQERNSLKAAGAAMLGMAAVGLGGLGLSLVVDAYSEEALGKKRNLRALRIPTSGSDWVGIQERINRIGTFGLWGELINGTVNVGTGQGDNRMLSVDQRVVAMQAFQSVQKAISAFINQDFDPDYMHVVRPMISSIGGGGMLQYMQIMNHAFDLDNVESRTVRRINAENYLRVTGRDLGISIRSSGGGYNTPTPITPWLARMEYAAYANDPSEFREMYNGAIEEAKRAGKPNPADYIKRAFETRHPLRYVFAQTPSEREYREILANMDDRGQEDVQDAIRLFNYYGSHIGLTPFLGSKAKDQRRTPLNVTERARALSMAY